MKKRVIAGLVAAIMAMSSFITPVLARYTAENSTYVYEWTTDLKATIDQGNGKIVLTWPAVNTKGELLNENHLTADGQVNSNGCPTAGWTNPTSGMIIVYNNWSPDPALNAVKNDKKTEHDVIKGLVDYETEYPVVVKDGQTGDFVKNAYIDTTVVSNSLATAYRIEYSEDGVTWTEDHIAGTYDHGKKLSRPDGSNDSKNTFFLEDQITEALTSSLKPETTYKIRVSAFDASTPSTKTTPYKVFETEITTPSESVLTPAFPTVEGGGTYAQGGRGTEQQQGDVYVVTNLTDSVSDPQPGSLRYGLERRDRADGNKLYPRTIVFAVGGTIHVDPAAGKNERRFNINSNTTIAGQTAPGEGITIAGASTKFNGSNIIVRYIRFRLGSGYDLDGASASGENIVIDHCTFSYGVDEVFSAKELVNSSIQYNIIDSGLSIPDKDGANNIEAEIGADSAKHGMGSIINGYETSFTHNLWSNNGTRNPRFEGAFSYNNVTYTNKLDFDNNVIYNWGHGSGYGGDRGAAEVNFENNYYISGPNTLAKVKAQFFDCDIDSKYGNVKSSYFFGGNVMEGNTEITADNEKGFIDLNTAANKLSSRVAMKVPYAAETADSAYQAVLDFAGASLHRDPWDNRLIQQVKNNTGYFVNSQDEAGGFNTEMYVSTTPDTDSDGLPDAWEDIHGLDKNNKNDSTLIINDASSLYNGYTNLEVYLSDLAGDWDYAPTGLTHHVFNANNAQQTVNITSIKDSDGNDLDLSVNADLKLGTAYTITTDDTAANGFDVYLNEKVAAHGANGQATFTPDTLGSYNLSVLSLGNGTDAPVRIFSDRVRVTVASVDAAPKAGLMGDVDCDGSITAFDASIVLQYVLNKAAVNISPQGMANAQVKDGEIDASFASAILQKALVSTFPFENETAVNGTGTNLDGFISAEIGNVRAPGYDFYDPDSNTLITEGNGFLGRTGSSSGGAESIHFNYKEVTGNVTITAKIYNWAKLDYYQFSGLMVRGGLSDTDEFYAAGMAYLKDEDFDGLQGVNGKRFEGRNILSVYRATPGMTGATFYTNGAGGARYLGVPQAVEGTEQIGGWAKIVREGNKITTYGSLDGTTWYELYTRENVTLPDTIYVGFATSSAQDTMDLVTYNKSLITDIDIQNSAVYPQ